MGLKLIAFPLPDAVCGRCLQVALNYEELAEQPLLLLMLALYDADANALQHRSAALGQNRTLRATAERFR